MPMKMSFTKKTSLLIALCLVIALVPMVAMAETMYVDTPNGGNLTMRTGPSTDYDAMTSIPYGAPVQIIEYLMGGSFVNVSYNGYYGYVMLRYLSEYQPMPGPVYPTEAPMPGPVYPTYAPNPTARPTVKPTAKPTSKPSNNTSNLEKTLSEMFAGFTPTSYEAVVKPSTPTTYVNLRWAPSKSGPVRTQYWAGTQLKVLSDNGTWSEVYDAATGIHGYMMNTFLQPVSYGAGSDS